MTELQTAPGAPPRPPARRDESASDSTDTAADHSLAARFGANLKRQRIRRGHSLSRLADLSGVSRAMLSQIETGRSSPSIVVAQKIATALSVPLQSFIDDQRRPRIQVLRRVEGSPADAPVVHRRLSGTTRDEDVVIDELRLAPGGQGEIVEVENGRWLHLAIARGEVHVRISSGEQVLLLEGDAVVIECGTAHRLRNMSQNEAVLYSVSSPRT